MDGERMSGFHLASTENHGFAGAAGRDDAQRQPDRRIVNSWNEWDPLEEVVVGTATGACYDPSEPGYAPRVRDGIGAFPRGPRLASTVEQANAELDGLVKLLESRDVTVRRPSPFDFAAPARTPTFATDTHLGATCPRDVMITIGSEVIEAPMSRRARYFEYLAYRPLMAHYFEADPKMTWVAGPKPTMSDTMYRPEFWTLSADERDAAMHRLEFCVTADDVLFDAADLTRMGRDVFVQESMTTNRAGVSWLRRHLGQRGLRTHRVRFLLDRFPSHIDCTFVPLRPGLVLTNPDRPLHPSDRAPFTANDWRFVDAPEPVRSDAEMPRHCQSSRWLSMNVLSLSPTVIVCEEREYPLHERLHALGFEVLTVPFSGVYELGGSLHCATWDVRRRGNREDYFPQPCADRYERGS